MQIMPIYNEGERVYVKTEGSGQKHFYVQKVLGRRYKLRTGATKGVGVLPGTYLEKHLSDEPHG